MFLKKTRIKKNSSLGNEDEKNRIIKTLHLMMQMKKHVL